MAQLLALDVALHGTSSMAGARLPRAKPEARVCDVCGQATGVSARRHALHMRTQHGCAGGTGGGSHEDLVMQ
jgi:hypothetical protein